MPKILATILSILITVLITAHSARASEWDSNQINLGRDPLLDFDSRSAAKAQLPAGLTVSPIPAGSPFAVLSGTWRGWECQDRRVDTRLAFVSASASNAKAVLAIASDEQPKTRNATFEIEPKGNEFTGTFGSLTYYFKPRQLGTHEVLDFQFFRNGHKGCFGVLIKDSPSSVAEQPR